VSDWFEEYLIKLRKESELNPPRFPENYDHGSRVYDHEIVLDDPNLFIVQLDQVAPARPLIDNKRALTPLIRAQQKINALPPLPPPDPPAPSPEVELPPLEEPLPPLPAVEDSPRKQGAPEVPAEIRIDIRPSPGPVDPTRVPEYYWSLTGPVLPRSIEDLIARQQPPPANNSDFDALVRQTLRNGIPGERHPSHSEPVPRRPTAEADPVDLHSGAFTLMVTDLVVPSPRFRISMTRRYRSGRPYYGPFGFGWDHDYNVYLRPLKDGAIAVWTGQLHEEVFKADGGGFRPESGTASDLKRLPGAVEVYTLRFPGGDLWRFERPAGWTDAERIPLVRIADRHGNALSLSYGPLSRVTSVLDEAGRGILFHYGQCELLEKVTDHRGERAVLYHHDPYVEHLVRVTLPATAQYADGVSTTYEYDARNPHPAMQHNILRVFDATGQLMVENIYGAPEEEWRFNCVLVQRIAGYEYQFDYEQLQYVWPDPAYVDILAHRTMVRPPDGALHIYSFNYRGDVLDYRLRLVRDRSFRVVASQFRYDAEGNLTESVEPNGRRTVYTYDHSNLDACARRNLLKVELFPDSPGPASRVVMRAFYDPKHQLVTRVVDEDGNETRAFYDFDSGVANATGRLERVRLPGTTLPNGTVQQSEAWFENNTQGDVLTATAPGGARTQYERFVAGPKAGFLKRIVADSTGAALALENDYDAAGFPSQVVIGGRTLSLTNNALGQREAMAPPSLGPPSEPLRQWFGDAGQVVRVDRPAGSYAEPGFTGPAITDLYKYDIQGALTEAVLGANTPRRRRIRIQPDHVGRPVRSWDASGVRTDRLFDERGLLLSETIGAGGSQPLETRFTYDRVGRMTHRHDPDGATTAFHYDSFGRLNQVELPTGAIRRLSWASRDLIASILMEEPLAGGGVQPLSEERFGYDERRRLTTRTVLAFADKPAAAVSLVTRQTFDAGDRPVQIELPRGGIIALAYDGAGRHTLAEFPSGAIRTYSYAASGDLAATTFDELPGGPLSLRTTTFDYDARGRLTAVNGPLGRVELDLDERGLIIERREPGGRITRFSNGPHGELDRRVRDPLGLALSAAWTYDACGRPVSFTDPTGEITRWQRDGLGREVAITYADGSVWRRTFDAAGRLAETLAPSGSKAVFGYKQGFPSPVSLTPSAPAGIDPVEPHTFIYDSLGRMISAANDLGAVLHRYDSLDRVISEEAQGQILAFAYDDPAGASTLTLPDGRVERTIYDLAGRPISVELDAPGGLGGTAGQTLLDLSYQGATKLLAESHANGVTADHRRDDAGRPVRIDITKGGTLLDSHRVAHDAAGHRAVQQTLGPNPRSWRFAFDAAGRLTDARRNLPLPPLVGQPAAAQPAFVASVEPAALVAPGETYAVNAADQRVSRTATGSPLDVYATEPGHRIVAENGLPITYYPDGQRRTGLGLDYDFDALGRPVRVRDQGNGADLVHLQYDALSRPAAGFLGGEQFARWFVGHQWVHQAAGMAAAIHQRSLHPLTVRAFRQADLAGELYIHADAGESSMCVTDASGAVQERHRFGPFGEPSLYESDGVTALAATASAVGPVWRSMEYLGAAGIYTTPVRLYDPGLGEFTSRDPLLFIDSPSPYAFAGHNPADFIDPLGLSKAPLGDPSAKQAPPDDGWLYKWSTRPDFYYYPDYGGPLKPITHLDTGFMPLNIVLNKISPWYNVAMFNMMSPYQNIVLVLLEDIDKELRRILGVNYGAFMSMPVMKMMGIEVFAAEEVALAVRGASVYLKAVNWRNLALNLLPTGAGAFGGGNLPLFKSATRTGMSYQYLGDTPVMSEAAWAQYQMWVTGSKVESMINLVNQTGQAERTIYLDSSLRRLNGGPILEAKYGDLGQLWNPDRYNHIIRQSYDLIDIAKALKLPGVEYRVSTKLGKERLISTLTWEHPQELESGFLIVRLKR
jgi:RHS repeat-associated protein